MHLSNKSLKIGEVHYSVEVLFLIIFDMFSVFTNNNFYKCTIKPYVSFKGNVEIGSHKTDGC